MSLFKKRTLERCSADIESLVEFYVSVFCSLILFNVTRFLDHSQAIAFVLLRTSEGMNTTVKGLSDLCVCVVCMWQVYEILLKCQGSKTLT